jgi:hypothetical protein
MRDVRPAYVGSGSLATDWSLSQQVRFTPQRPT